ncbi:MAG: flagellar FliJ family protein [Alphaproteobacteria bacterium]|nr:flagellar FliJ family protein [Alphaproteobacteria bacterium]
MGKDLHTVIRLAKYEVDEKRRALGEILEREHQIERAQAHIEAQRDHEEATARADPVGVGMSWGNYVRRYMAERDNLAAMLASVREAIEAAREELAESYRRLKTYEQAQAARDRRAQEELNRKEQTALDEMAQNMVRRRGEGGGTL